MKLDRQLNINNAAYPVIEDRVLLDLDAPDRAQFVIDAGDKPVQAKQVVSFTLGYAAHDTMQRVFLGFVESVNNMDRRRRRLQPQKSGELLQPGQRLSGHAVHGPGIFDIENYIWQQQGHGVIYAGSWDDSRWADKSIEMGGEMFTEHLTNNSAKIVAVKSRLDGITENNPPS